MNKASYVIKKTMINPYGRKTHVFMTDGSSEVLEMKHKNVADKMCEVMNANTDSGCSYKVITIGKSEEE
jgi:hypothetical protein